jgi:hypothetical protein
LARGTTAVTAAVRESAAHLAAAAMEYVQEESGSVRVEDYVAVLATLTGEAALVAADLYDIESSTITPGAAVFGDAINRILSGDQADVAKCPADSVVGILVSELVPTTVALDLFGPLDRFYAWVAESVGKAEWGNVTTSVAESHKPRIMPLRVAFELRGTVDAAQSKAGLARNFRHVVCAVALTDCLKQVKPACDMTMAVTLAMEVTFGTAKMAPMSRAAFETVARGEGAEKQI